MHQRMQTKEMNPGERITSIQLTADTLSVDLVDGRTITVPLARFPRLRNANPSQLANWQISGNGYGIHWPEIDEDLSTAGLLRSTPRQQ